MAKKDTTILKEYAYIGIHRVEPLKKQELEHHTYTHTQEGGIEPIRPGVYHLPATHIIYLMQRTWNDNFRVLYKKQEIPTGIDFANPNQDVGMTIWCRRKFLDRNPGSCFLFHNGNLYHTLSWTDILGSKHGKESAPSWIKDGKRYIYVHQRTNEECKLLIKTYQEEQPKARVGWNS